MKEDNYIVVQEYCDGPPHRMYYAGANYCNTGLSFTNQFNLSKNMTKKQAELVQKHFGGQLVNIISHLYSLKRK